ncbi:hypothetical protein CR152_26135 [Massilia violaceinigra]|uniref:Uncharacterized protein n=1 Tax=Massilia violaceinigra TaxID=2045208 RepID=A0A2D2DRJ0_9BURK|nr:hypothetical protein [Massilia violaceinigra]ATQ77594.1 hypothetical protein CR152_26135 [Massilia violaceinigra]
MIGLFKRPARATPPDTSALGAATLALRMDSGCTVPKGCIGVVADTGGHTRRVAEASRIVLAEIETAFCFHPGPYGVDLLPFAAAPELGLRLSFAVDGPDPRVAQQRFDLYLASEAGDTLGLGDFAAAIEAALQQELGLGHLALPPCTTLDEWNAFRAGFNQLLYTRFGISVDDCIPVDLGERVDYAALLLARAVSMPEVRAPQPQPLQVCAAMPFDAAAADARALRRLFLELPCVMHGLRMAVLPPGQALFQQHMALLQRLDNVSLSVNAMPALALAAPGETLPADRQLTRTHHSLRASAALDEAWALLARLGLAADADLAPLFDDADRIIANLEHECAARRVAVLVPESEPA